MSEKKKSKLPAILGVLFAIIIIGGIIFALTFSSVAKKIAERVASDTLGVKVTISDLKIDLQELKVTLNGITIDNPPGFREYSNAVELSSISIDAHSFDTKPLAFDSIEVGNTKVFLELSRIGSNLGKIKENLGKAPKEETAANEAIKVIISKLDLGQSELYAVVPVLNREEINLKLPNIKLTGIGERSNGILAREAVAQVMDKIIDVSAETAAKNNLLSGVLPAHVDGLGVPQDLVKPLNKIKNTDGRAMPNLQGILGQ